MSQITVSDLRANMASHFDRLEADRTELVVTRQNHEPLAVLPLAELEALRETLYLLNSAANADLLRQSIAELSAGKGIGRKLAE